MNFSDTKHIRDYYGVSEDEHDRHKAMKYMYRCWLIVWFSQSLTTANGKTGGRDAKRRGD